METYRALDRHDGRAWVVEFDRLELSTWARSLTKAQQYAREALAVTLDYDSVEELEKAVTIEDHVRVSQIVSGKRKPRTQIAAKKKAQ